MKKMLNLAAICLGVFAVMIVTQRASFGRVTSPADDRDIWCVGPSGAEICVDTSGNIIPTTDDDVDLGKSSLQFQDAYLDGTLYVDAISNEGAMTATTGTFTGQVTLQSVSSTTIASLTPAAVGSIVYNSTRFALCVATATTAGAWVFQSTNPITNAGVSCKE